MLSALPKQNDLVPRLRHADAAIVGERLARHWNLLVDGDAPPAGDLFWADLVQFVLHCARETAAEISTNAEGGRHD